MVDMIRILLVMVLAAVSLSAQTPFWIDPARVLVVYNGNWPDEDGNGIGESEQLALEYQAKRGVPAANLLSVGCSTNQYYYYQLAGWSAFWNEVRTPIVQRLQALGETNIFTILFCRGVPYRVSLPSGNGGGVSLDHLMMTPHALGTAATPSVSNAPGLVWTSPYFDLAPGLGTGLPHFTHAYWFQGTRFYLVSRLDGDSHDRALDLIEGALYGDRYVSPDPGYYQGRLYVDTRYSTYPNPASLPWPLQHVGYGGADSDMARVVPLLEPIGFDVWWENTTGSYEIGEVNAMYRNGQPAQFAPDALFYYGWYNYITYRDVWSWLPGSAACDLNSNSIAGLRTGSTSFGKGALDRGLTCGVGVIGEPYLAYHPWPETFISYLMRGHAFAEAAAASDRAQKFRTLFIGDPLYCPMQVGKIADLDTVAPPAPDVSSVSVNGTDATFRVALNTLGREPDLVTVGGGFGAAPALVNALDHGAHYRVARTITLDNLTPGTYYRANLIVRDPVGNTTPLPELQWFQDPAGTLAAAVQPSDPAPAAAQPVTLEFAMRIPGGLASLTSLAMNVTFGGAAFDLIPLLPLVPTTPHLSMNGETISLEVHVPTGLSAGTWTFALDVSTATTTQSASTVVTVP
ncbi:MAG: hypothetical protein CMJ83_04170 [Planctomycetes bacterium]|nr:hypothetical protein [Planctomycetota bacterium]